MEPQIATDVTITPAVDAGPTVKVPEAKISEEGGATRVILSEDSLAKDNITGEAAATKESADQKPAWVPEKFWKDGKLDAEGMAKSYSELEKKQGQAPVKTEEKPAEQAPVVTKIAGVTSEQLSKYTEEMKSKQALSPESYAELEKAGYSKAVVDAYVRGITPADPSEAVKAAHDAEQRINDMMKKVGGEEAYDKMIDWAKQTLTPEEITAFNSAVGHDDPKVQELVIAGLHARYTKENGVDPELLEGEGGDGAIVTGYRDTDELTKAMSDPRYAASEAYRREVAIKLNASKFV